MPEPKSSASPARKSADAARVPATFDLRQPLIVLRAHLAVAAAMALVAGSLVAWQQLRQPKQYAAQAALIVERPDRVEGERVELVGMELSVATRLEQLRSPELLQRVVASFTPEERSLLHGQSDAGAKGADDATPRRFARAVSIERREGTALLQIQAVHGDPVGAALLANRFAQEAIRYAHDRSSAATDASLQFLRAQAEDLRKKSEEAEKELQEYRQRYNLVSLEDNQNIIVDNLKSLNASATSARVRRVAIEAQLAQAEAVLKRGKDAAQIASVAESPGLTDLARRIGELRSKRAVIGERYGRRHPAMQENQREIEALEKLQDEEITVALGALRDQRDKARAEEQQLAAQLAKAEKEALSLDQLGVGYNILRRTVETHKASYSQILARLNDATISTQLRGVNMKISELATPPGAPFSPNPQKTLLITVALVVAILVGYPFSAEMFFGRVRGATDVEHHLNMGVIGEIGAVRKVQEKDRPFLVNSENDEAAAEQFRALYSQLVLSSKIDPPKTILITSTVPGEGKSFIAANLAQSFVAHGRKTLLIDADLRRPTQHRNFKLGNTAGLLRWIEQGGGLEGDLLTDPDLGITQVLPGLFLLRAGGVTRKATELLDGPRLSALIPALQRQFELVIFDTPPAGVFPDALAFAKIAHELIFICRFNTVSRQAVREVLQRLRQTGLEMPGVVMNAMPSGLGGGYYYQNYSYQDSKKYSKRYAEKK